MTEEKKNDIRRWEERALSLDSSPEPSSKHGIPKDLL